MQNSATQTDRKTVTSGTISFVVGRPTGLSTAREDEAVCVCVGGKGRLVNPPAVECLLGLSDSARPRHHVAGAPRLHGPVHLDVRQVHPQHRVSRRRPDYRKHRKEMFARDPFLGQAYFFACGSD